MPWAVDTAKDTANISWQRGHTIPGFDLTHDRFLRLTPHALAGRLDEVESHLAKPYHRKADRAIHY